MDRTKIEDQAQNVFEWPTGGQKDTVTLTSCILFAKMVADAERERCALLCERLPYGSGLAGRTYAEAIRGEGMGGKLAEGTNTEPANTNQANGGSK